MKEKERSEASMKGRTEAEKPAAGKSCTDTAKKDAAVNDTRELSDDESADVSGGTDRRWQPRRSITSNRHDIPWQ